jgi:hypothetical protein
VLIKCAAEKTTLLFARCSGSKGFFAPRAQNRAARNKITHVVVKLETNAQLFVFSLSLASL